jgi:peptidoglycan/xylan/chitin deacetylase (PgdA/CDA1 family)
MGKSAKMPLVVGYHRVVEEFEAEARGYIPSMLISQATLEKQLDWIGREFEFVDPDMMGKWLNGERSRGGKRVAVVTFDDGYRDVYEHAFPILRRKGIPALVFVVTGLVGTQDLQIHDALYLVLRGVLGRVARGELSWDMLVRAADVELVESGDPGRTPVEPYALMRRLFTTQSQRSLRALIARLQHHSGVSRDVPSGMRMLTWEMLAEMQNAGVRIGSHTVSHALLTNESAEFVADQLSQSQRVLSEKLGGRAAHFAYPDGRFNRWTAEAVAEAGYRYAYTICQHRDARFPNLTIPRRILWEKSCVDGADQFSASIMRCQVNGLLDLFSTCNMNHGFRNPLDRAAGRTSHVA